MKKKWHWLKTSIVVLLLVVPVRVVCGYGAGIDNGVRPFQVKSELALGLPAAKTAIPSLVELRDLFLGKDDDILILWDPDERKNDLHAVAGDARSFRLSFFSRSVFEERDKDVLRPGNGDDDALGRIRALPSLIVDSSTSTREKFEAIGGIFRPQLFLEIKF